MKPETKEKVILLCAREAAHANIKVRRLLRMKTEEEFSIQSRINDLLRIFSDNSEEKKEMIKKINKISSDLTDEICEKTEGNKEEESLIKNFMNNKK